MGRRGGGGMSIMRNAVRRKRMRAVMGRMVPRPGIGREVMGPAAVVIDMLLVGSWDRQGDQVSHFRVGLFELGVAFGDYY